MDAAKINKMIQELEERQRKLIAEMVAAEPLRGSHAEERGMFREVGEMDAEMAGICCRLIALRKALTMGDEAEEFLKSLPTLEEIKQSANSLKEATATLFSDLFSRYSEALRKKPVADEPTATVDEDILHAFDAIISLIKAKQRPIARITLAQFASEKGAFAPDDVVAQIINNIEVLVDGGYKEAAIYIFAKLLERRLS